MIIIKIISITCYPFRINAIVISYKLIITEYEVTSKDAETATSFLKLIIIWVFL